MAFDCPWSGTNVEKWELQIYQKAGQISSYFDICSKILSGIWEYYPLIERIVHSMRTTVHKTGTAVGVFIPEWILVNIWKTNWVEPQPITFGLWRKNENWRRWQPAWFEKRLLRERQMSAKWRRKKGNSRSKILQYFIFERGKRQSSKALFLRNRRGAVGRLTGKIARPLESGAMNDMKYKV